jgi:hypothetical protein
MKKSLTITALVIACGAYCSTQCASNESGPVQMVALSAVQLAMPQPQKMAIDESPKSAYDQSSEAKRIEEQQRKQEESGCCCCACLCGCCKGLLPSSDSCFYNTCSCTCSGPCSWSYQGEQKSVFSLCCNMPPGKQEMCECSGSGFSCGCSDICSKMTCSNCSSLSVDCGGCKDCLGGLTDCCVPLCQCLGGIIGGVLKSCK